MSQDGAGEASDVSAARPVQIGLYLTNQHPVGSDMVQALGGQIRLLHHARDHGLIGRDSEFVSAATFKLGRRVAGRADREHLARVLSRRTVREGRGTSLRAVVELRYGCARRLVLKRSLPACGMR